MSRVTLTNPFDLLTDENEDRTNVPAKKEQKPAAPAAKPAAKPAATSAAVAKPAAKPDAKAPAKPAENKPTGNSANQVVKPGPPRDANQNLQEREKETRAPRDKRDRPARPADDSKRPFDRKSGTGRIKNEQSRGGHGRGNWGEVDTKEGVEALKDKEGVIVDEKEGGEDTSKDEKVTVEGEKKEGEAAKEGEATPATPKEEEVFTYDEYLKNRKTKAPVVEALKPRTVTDSDFGSAGLVPLQRENGAPATKKEKKPEKVATEKAAPADKASAENKAAVEKEKKLANDLFKFASHQDAKRAERGPYRSYDDNRRGGGERRGGGAPRGGGSGNPRAPRTDYAGGNKGNTTASQPPVQEKDFPALGPHGSEPVKP